jgi:aryl-alcohol dehydrogenase-like predicted oxidoreductase
MPLVGVKTLAQAKANLRATGWKLANAEVDAIDTAARKVKKTAVQNIFQNS